MTTTYPMAEVADLAVPVTLLANDVLGATREDLSVPLNPEYVQAFEEISSEPNNEIIVAEIDGRITGMLQLTMILAIDSKDNGASLTVSG